MDLKASALLLLVLTLTSCGVKYTTSEFLAEEEIGYECVIYTPESHAPIGEFLYLSDSNEVFTEPSPLMLSYLKKDYRVIVPIRWGATGRSKSVLDSYEARMRGASYSLNQFQASIDTVLPVSILGEGFYGPIALRMARDNHSPELILVEPLSQSLEMTLMYQYMEGKDTAEQSLIKLWGLSNDSLRQTLYDVIKHRSSDPEAVFNTHYSAFLRSYWLKVDSRELLNQQNDSIIDVILHPEYPLETTENQQFWENSNVHILKWPENKPRPSYSIAYWETLLLNR